jgi:hypothetical protein
MLMVMMRGPHGFTSACAILVAAAAAACSGGPIDSAPGGTGATPGVGTGGSSGVGGSATGGATSEVITLPGGLKLEGTPGYYRVVRLTHSQWENSVRDALQLPEAPGLSSGFLPDPPDGKFSNNERALYVSDTLWQDYQRSAEDVAELVATDATALGRLGDAGDSEGFISAVGERAFRRALTADELADYSSLWDQGATFFASGDDFADGAQVFLEALLQSPHFLYRIELSEPGARLTGIELATKISYLLRDTTPNEELLDAAAAGTLDTDAGLAGVVADMLDEEGASSAMEKFHRELYGIDRYISILKNETAFPDYDPSLNQGLIDADVMFFSRVYTQEFGLREILRSDVAFVSPATADFYGVTLPTGGGQGLREVTLDGTRPGFLTRLGFLAYNATLNDPDPIHRGVDINNRMLCQHLSPPAGEIPPLPESMPGQTNRQRVEAHTGEGFCAGCHAAVINPPGFSLETFDAIGRVRTMDGDQAIDTTGTFVVAEQSITFDDIDDLTTQLAETAVAHTCYAANLAEFALSRDLGAGEVTLVTDVQGQSQANDASIKQMLLTMIQSPSFTTARAAQQ